MKNLLIIISGFCLLFIACEKDPFVSVYENIPIDNNKNNENQYASLLSYFVIEDVCIEHGPSPRDPNAQLYTYTIDLCEDKYFASEKHVYIWPYPYFGGGPQYLGKANLIDANELIFELKHVTNFVWAQEGWLMQVVDAQSPYVAIGFCDHGGSPYECGYYCHEFTMPYNSSTCEQANECILDVVAGLNYSCGNQLIEDLQGYLENDLIACNPGFSPCSQSACANYYEEIEWTVVVPRLEDGSVNIDDAIFMINNAIWLFINGQFPNNTYPCDIVGNIDNWNCTENELYISISLAFINVCEN